MFIYICIYICIFTNIYAYIHPHLVRERRPIQTDRLLLACSFPLSV